jgi:hypothetical protein
LPFFRFDLRSSFFPDFCQHGSRSSPVSAWTVAINQTFNAAGKSICW